MKWTVNNDRLAAEILSFYDWLETNCMGTSCICLWLALMHTWHKAGCPEEFAVAMSTLEGKTGLKKDAIGEARNRLQQQGRISWRKRSGRASAVYSVVEMDGLGKQGIRWVIIGAETKNGKVTNPPPREWIKEIVDACRSAGTPVFLKDSLAAVWGEPLIREYPWEV